MKMRLGFVSNSSSVSFVIDKCDVKNLNSLRSYLEAMQDEEDRSYLEAMQDEEDTRINETDKHFFGTYSMNNEVFEIYLKSHGIPMESVM